MGVRAMTRRAVRLGTALVMAATLLAALPGAASAELELGEGAWFTLVDGDGNVLCYTGLSLGVGDEYIDEANRLWRVSEIVGRTAVADLVETLDLSTALTDFQTSLAAGPWAQQTSRKVGIYSTHSDESYVPSDGRESDPSGNGGVYKVGAALADSLESQGVRTEQSTTSHLPHDSGAYARSRRTASELMRGAAAIFDVHRDAAPAEAYLRRVGGRDVTQVLIVIGRANPQAEANLDFAKAIKAASDQQKPGLIRGILTTGGKFNQDLSAHALLFEFGAHTNEREDAEAAATFLGAIIPGVLGLPGGGVAAGGWRALGLIALLVLVVGGGWLYITVGGDWRAVWDKLRSLPQEFASYLGRRPPRK